MFYAAVMHVCLTLSGVCTDTAIPYTVPSAKCGTVAAITMNAAPGKPPEAATATIVCTK